MTMKFNSLKHKNRRVRSAVHRAVSIGKLNSPPVNRLVPKVKVRTTANHLSTAVLENLYFTDITIHNRENDSRQYPFTLKKR